MGTIMSDKTKVFFVGGAEHGAVKEIEEPLPKVWHATACEGARPCVYVLHTVQLKGQNHRVFISQDKEFGGLVASDFQHVA